MKRFKISKRKSKRSFSKHAGQHKRNAHRMPMRGGIRF